jgi:glycosyltransferase involved in cell wall biosynthesis
MLHQLSGTIAFLTDVLYSISMRLLYIADGRSPIALNWISFFIRSGNEVHLASTFPCQPLEGLASLMVIPVAMSGVYGQPEIRSGNRGRMLRQIISVALRTRLRGWVAPLSFPRAANTLREMTVRIQPDLVHAMRIPYEGIIASNAMRRNTRSGGGGIKSPLLISVWGNDLTLHGRSTSVMGNYTSQALHDCAALHTDCQRDLDLAIEFGFSSTKPSIVLPGGGGVKLCVFYPAEELSKDGEDHHWVDEIPVTIINPRGFRAYVRNDTFFQAIPMVLTKYPKVRFVCPGMADEAQAHKWIEELGISAQVELLPKQSQMELANLFRRSQISVSITTHDGTPNTLLEAMACGCFPIAGDIQSLHEWINPGENGLLVDPGDSNALAMAIQEVISQPELRKKTRERNLQLVKERAEYEKTMHSAEDFYNLVLEIY